jgi:dephospho-CoA kinase
MIVIGLTGGIASGKSLVADELARRGALVAEADRWGHEVLREPAVRAALHARWGAAVLDTTGEIHRAAVAQIVFAAGPDGLRERAFLERTTHPRITDRLVAWLEQQSQRHDVLAAVLDAPLLHSAGWASLCDVILFVEADEAIRAERARTRGWTDAQRQARQAAQVSLCYQRGRADLVIPNSGTREDLAAQVAACWQTLTRHAGRTNFRKLVFTNPPESS